jgi:hypothetical protein
MSLVRSCWWSPLLTACLAEAPASPGFQDEVLPILAANCARCHSYPAIGGAPSACDVPSGGAHAWCGFRLDGHDDVVVDEGDPGDPTDDLGVRGAAFIAGVIPARIGSSTSPMPPRFPLDDVARLTLEAWSRGLPEPPSQPPRIARPGNALPTISLEPVVRDAGSVVVRYELDDADGDLVVGGLRVRGAGIDTLLAPIRSGRDEVRWSPDGVPAGAYELIARVDDGGGWQELTAGTLIVEAP